MSIAFQEFILHPFSGFFVLGSLFFPASTYAALRMMTRARRSHGRNRILWALLSAASLTTGVCLWFAICLLSYEPGIEKLYGLQELTFSAAAAACGCFVAAYLAYKQGGQFSRVVSGAAAAAGFIAAGYFATKSIAVIETAPWDSTGMLGLVLSAAVITATLIHAFGPLSGRRAHALAVIYLGLSVSGLYLSFVRAVEPSALILDANGFDTLGSGAVAAAGIFAGLFLTILFAAAYCLDRVIRTQRTHLGHLEDIVAQLTRSEERAIAANTAKSEFIANVSHELRTPLTGIAGMLDLLSKGDLSDAQRHQINLASQATGALQTLVKDLLDLSRIEAGKFRLEERPADIRRVIDGVASLMTPACVEKGILFDWRVGQEVPELVLIDPDRLRQVLLNLISNAVKFTENGGITVSASARPADNDALMMEIQIRDTGIGIDEQTQKRLFARYAQADSSIKSRFGGEGLGLSISRHLAEMMGGGIEVESAQGAGSTFTVRIRCKKAQTRNPKTKRRSSKESAPAAMSILLAEDNEINQYLVTELLSRKGHSVSVADNGLDAVTLAAAQPFDAILMDVQMPDIDGLEATRMIRSSDGPNKATPILALTAGLLPSQQEKQRQAGMTDCVEKPVNPAKLYAALEGNAVTDNGVSVAVSDSPYSDVRLPDKHPCLDARRLAVLEEIFGEDELREQLELVAAETQIKLREIQSALSAGDLKLAKQHAHTLNGMAGSWAAAKVGKAARTIEIDAQSIQDAAACTEELETAVIETRKRISLRAARGEQAEHNSAA
ncbi:MAG: ATP-binding protein [Pseudomonadota bacterium]